MNQDKISVVIPVYNEEQGLEELFRQLVPVMEGMGRSYEIVLVDDGSTDRSLEILKRHAGEKIRVVELTRNYGQHAAVFAGFESSDGAIVVTMDADLQNPPQEIPRLVKTMEEGNYEVVGTIRLARQDSLFRRTASSVVNAMTRKITGVNLNDWGCMLRAYRREVVRYMVESREHSTFIPALATTFAKRITEIEVGHNERFAGESKYSLLKLVALQFDLVTSFSEFPLKLLFYLGSLMSLLGVGFGVFLAVARLYFGALWAAQGVFTLFAVLFFFMGAQFLAFGLMGEYVGRIYREVKRRPSYTVRRIY
ncbi:MAG TPA: glycosyltransferase [Deltaproteobacteria bacterium]|jgi:undecaprenyl-phosphate 4-deoxy-4-formamido-L-arabinose transferase|nr:glycosyltransferase [Deltaproteobacteria bacterium]HOI06703.1 glycosyltransferase [Deltaproteobacteria bacterium]